MKFVAFLRGINVNGIKIKMKDLEKILLENGYAEATTILATGNVILESNQQDWTFAMHKAHIEKVLSEAFQYEAYVFLRSAEQIYQGVAHAQSMKPTEADHHYYLVAEDSEVGKRLQILFDQCKKAEGEQFIAADQGLYWIVPKGDTLNSEFGNKVLGKKEFKSILTSRNMNTMRKILSRL